MALKGESIIPHDASFWLVLGSIFGGAATPTEAAGVGAVGAPDKCRPASDNLTWENVKDALLSHDSLDLHDPVDLLRGLGVQRRLHPGRRR